MHEAVWHGDACVGSALALDQQDDYVSLPAPSLCGLAEPRGFSLTLWFSTSEVRARVRIRVRG